jgi:hypothetical protein
MADDVVEPAAEPSPEPLLAAVIEALMTHAAPGGAVEYPRAASVFVALLAEMIGQQSHALRDQMMAEFTLQLRSAVHVAVLRSTVLKGKAQ